MTQWIYNNDVSNPIGDGSPWTGPDGTHYPWNWDKSTIEGMVAVVEVPEPTGINVLGSHVELVDGVPTQVWETTPITSEQILQQNADARQRAYNAAMNAGCAIVSAGTPAISGTYGLDATSISNMLATDQFITKYNMFPNGAQTMAWVTLGAPVMFPSPSAAELVFKIVAIYVTAWKQYAGGLTTSPPSSSVDIA